MDKYTPHYTQSVMDELGDDYHQFYIAHPAMEKTPSLKHIPRHLVPAVGNAIKMMWESDKEKEYVNDPDVVGATHVAIHPHTGADKYLHPHEIAQHKLEGWHVRQLDNPVPKTEKSSGLKSPEQISVLYAGPTWLGRKHGGFPWGAHDSIYESLGSPKTLEKTAIIRPTPDEVEKIVKHVNRWEVYGQKGKFHEFHPHPFSIVAKSPMGWWDFGADHRTGDVEVYNN